MVRAQQVTIINRIGHWLSRLKLVEVERLLWTPTGDAIAIQPDRVECRRAGRPIDFWEVAQADAEDGASGWMLRAGTVGKADTTTLATFQSHRLARRGLSSMATQLNAGKKVNGSSWWFWLIIIFALWLMWSGGKPPSDTGINPIAPAAAVTANPLWKPLPMAGLGISPSDAETPFVPECDVAPTDLDSLSDGIGASLAPTAPTE